MVHIQVISSLTYVQPVSYPVFTFPCLLYLVLLWTIFLLTYSLVLSNNHETTGIGTLSPNELYHKTHDSGLPYEDTKTFSRRLIWRDLAYYQLYTFPSMRDRPIRKHYEDTEWVTGDEERRRLEAWKWVI